MDPRWDCHFHVFDPPAADARRGIDRNPSQSGTAAELLTVLDSHGIARGLAVGAGPYGTDNTVLVSALAASAGRLRGIGVLDPAISDRDFARLADAGVIGTRMNVMTWGIRQLVEPGADRLLARLREAGWFLQLHVAADDVLPAVSILERSGVRLMFDHFGRPDPRRGLDQPGFAAMLEFGRSTDAVVKLSAPYRCSLAGAPYDDIGPFVAAAIEAFTLDRCVWGSDWPFTNPPGPVEYGEQLSWINRILPDSADRQRVLALNPAHLFDRCSARSRRS
jgi:predicted TIM-barrel fold metal-dependent hydrolase